VTATHRSSAVAFTLALLGSLSPLAPANAHGAIALGVPADVEKDGVAEGDATNHASQAAAEKAALAECLSRASAPALSKLCRVYRTFSHQCVAVSLDPNDGTPGYGWAVMDTKPEAEAAAVEDCKNRSPDERKSYCVVSRSACDTMP